MKSAAISVVIPTIGRPAGLRRCLESIRGCKPGPDEVIVVDQSGGTAVARAAAEFSEIGVKSVSSSTRGVGPARNLGIERARNEHILITDDDCSVATDWISVATDALRRHPRAIHTGRVIPAGDRLRVPSTIEDPQAHDYTGRAECRVLYPNNMAFGRSRMLEFGGFDERFAPPAEDNDFCYRWLRAGEALRYEPALVVWHHDWRSVRELAELHRGYGYGQGAFYGKHLRHGDVRMLRFLVEDLAGLARSLVAAAVTGEPERSLGPRMMLRGLPSGLRWGWSEYRRD